MINKEKIINTVCEKIKYLRGEDFPIEKDFYVQLSEIRKHFISALKKETKNIEYSNASDMFLDTYTRLNPIQRESINKSFKKTYKITNSWLEQFFVSEKLSPYLFALLDTEWKTRTTSGTINGIFGSDYTQFNSKNIKEYWQMVDATLNYLKPEDLNGINRYLVNILDNRGNLNSAQTIQELKRCQLIIYLIKSNRLLKLVIEAGKLILNCERIIPKDLKMIEILGETKVAIYYHGFQNPDFLYVDSYEDALALRKQMNELREYKSS